MTWFGQALRDALSFVSLVRFVIWTDTCCAAIHSTHGHHFPLVAVILTSKTVCLYLVEWTLFTKEHKTKNIYLDLSVHGTEKSKKNHTMINR